MPGLFFVYGIVTLCLILVFFGLRNCDFKLICEKIALLNHSYSTLLDPYWSSDGC